MVSEQFNPYNINSESKLELYRYWSNGFIDVFHFTDKERRMIRYDIDGIKKDIFRSKNLKLQEIYNGYRSFLKEVELKYGNKQDN